MPRIRTIKPEFATSEQVGECSTTARLLFVQMWCFCDDAGRHSRSALRLKAECFPFDPFTKEDMEGFIGELISVGLLNEYEYEGEKYLQVTGWNHQKIEKKSYKYPPFIDGDAKKGPAEIRRSLDDHSASTHGVVAESSPPERKGKERKGKESTGRERREHSTPSRHLKEPGFASVWKSWTEHRSEKFKPLGDIEAEQQLYDLDRFELNEAIDIVRYSIGRGAVNLITDGSHRNRDGPFGSRNGRRLSLEDMIPND